MASASISTGKGCATELIERACDDARDVVYCNGLYGNEHDVLASLVDIYCRRALRIGTALQEALEVFWPPEAPWIDK